MKSFFYDDPSAEDIVTRESGSGNEGPARGGDITGAKGGIDHSAKPAGESFTEDQGGDNPLMNEGQAGPNTISRPFRPPANTTTIKDGQYGTSDAARAARAELGLQTFKGY